MFQANAWLSDKIVSRRQKFALYSDADGTGTSDTPMVARYMAISETMERWAYRVKVRATDRELYGFDIDESSNGMAAFPGIFHTEARRRATLEAVERTSIIAWWEGVIDGEVRSTEWPGISALVLPSPIGFGVTVVAFREVRPDCFAYGQGAAVDTSGPASARSWSWRAPSTSSGLEEGLGGPRGAGAAVRPVRADVPLLLDGRGAQPVPGEDPPQDLGAPLQVRGHLRHGDPRARGPSSHRSGGC